jgi:hypothetical protein
VRDAPDRDHGSRPHGHPCRLAVRHLARLARGQRAGATHPVLTGPSEGPRPALIALGSIAGGRLARRSAGRRRTPIRPGVGDAVRAAALGSATVSGRPACRYGPHPRCARRGLQPVSSVPFRDKSGAGCAPVRPDGCRRGSSAEPLRRRRPRSWCSRRRRSGIGPGSAGPWARGSSLRHGPKVMPAHGLIPLLSRPPRCQAWH